MKLSNPARTIDAVIPYSDNITDPYTIVIPPSSTTTIEPLPSSRKYVSDIE
jgi:hypothetical protein